MNHPTGKDQGCDCTFLPLLPDMVETLRTACAALAGNIGENLDEGVGPEDLQSTGRRSDDYP
jgi:hypothetical protein